MTPRFSGFDPAVPPVPLPGEFFTVLLDEIDDPLELRVALVALWQVAITAQPRRISAPQVAAWISGVEDVTPLLESLAKRGVLSGDPAQGWTWTLPADALPAQPGTTAPAPAVPEIPNVYRLYQDNIGNLTAAVADRLRDAEAAYPEAWIREAIEEAAVQNKRSWAYIEAILRRWKQDGRQEGRDDGTAARHPEAGQPAVERFGGRFAHLFARDSTGRPPG